MGMRCDLGRLFVLVLSTAVADFGGFTRIADRWRGRDCFVVIGGLRHEGWGMTIQIFLERGDEKEWRGREAILSRGLVVLYTYRRLWFVYWDKRGSMMKWRRWPFILNQTYKYLKNSICQDWLIESI